MAILASANWYIRAGGNALNGGGYDSAISGAGTNYCDQDAAQLSLTDLATSGAGSTTLTSATGGFTAAMVGNCIRIASGTNFQTGYYFVTAYTNTNTVTLDRTPTSGGAGSGGTGRLGGAFAGIAASLSTGGSVTAPTLTSPLAAGHTINLRGGGTDAPASADYTQTGYATYPAGDTTNGRIRVIGYNGRPRIDSNLCFYLVNLWSFENLMFVTNGATYTTLAHIHEGTNGAVIAVDCRFDQAGYDAMQLRAAKAYWCEFVNSGSTSAGTQEVWNSGNFFASAYGCSFIGTRGPASVLTTKMGVFDACVVSGCRSTGPALSFQSAADSYWRTFSRNTIHGNVGDGLKIIDAQGVLQVSVQNNVFYGNGGYGLNYSVGSLALNDRLKAFADYNAFGSNTSGARNGISAGAHDITLSADPFTNAAGGDFTLNSTAGGGAALKGVAFPTSIP